MSKADPLGYYQVLNVSPGASQSEIRLAYELLKQGYQEERRQLQIHKIRAAYKTLSDLKTRREYDAGAQPGGSPRAANRRRRGLPRPNVVKIGLAILLVGSIVLLVMIGPSLRAQLVSFDPGDQLVWATTGQNLGAVVSFDKNHEFKPGTVAPAYQILPADGGDPTWYPARDLQRHCRER